MVNHIQLFKEHISTAMFYRIGKLDPEFRINFWLISIFTIGIFQIQCGDRTLIKHKWANKYVTKTGVLRVGIKKNSQLPHLNDKLRDEPSVLVPNDDPQTWQQQIWIEKQKSWYKARDRLIMRETSGLRKEWDWLYENFQTKQPLWLFLHNL